MSDPILEIDLARKDLFWKFEHRLYDIFYYFYSYYSYTIKIKKSSNSVLTVWDIPLVHKSVLGNITEKDINGRT